MRQGEATEGSSFRRLDVGRFRRPSVHSIAPHPTPLRHQRPSAARPSPAHCLSRLRRGGAGALEAILDRGAARLVRRGRGAVALEARRVGEARVARGAAVRAARGRARDGRLRGHGGGRGGVRPVRGVARALGGAGALCAGGLVSSLEQEQEWCGGYARCPCLRLYRRRSRSRPCVLSSCARARVLCGRSALCTQE